MFQIVLYEPEIPQNTGNIARTCAVTGCGLHLIEPLGFSIDARQVRRAGLDYWDKVLVDAYPDFQAVLSQNPGANLYFLSTKGGTYYHQVRFRPGDYLVFGRETAGLPQEIMDRYRDRLIRLPMLPGLRSLNLANTVCATVYEALRQNGFAGML